EGARSAPAPESEASGRGRRSGRRPPGAVSGEGQPGSEAVVPAQELKDLVGACVEQAFDILGVAGGQRGGGEQRRDGQAERIGGCVTEGQKSVVHVVLDVVRLNAVAPTLFVEALISRDLLGSTVARSSLHVAEDTPVTIVHLVAQGSRPQAEVHVLVTVPKCAVEPRHVLEN